MFIIEHDLHPQHNQQNIGSKSSHSCNYTCRRKKEKDIFRQHVKQASEKEKSIFDV